MRTVGKGLRWRWGTTKIISKRTIQKFSDVRFSHFRTAILCYSESLPPCKGERRHHGAKNAHSVSETSVPPWRNYANSWQNTGQVFKTLLSDLARLAAGSSIGLTNAWRCMCSFELMMMEGKPRLKHVQRLTEINKLWNVASCWLYSAKILAMQRHMNVKP